jgi:hypothetical protein
MVSMEAPHALPAKPLFEMVDQPSDCAETRREARLIHVMQATLFHDFGMSGLGPNITVIARDLIADMPLDDVLNMARHRRNLCRQP